MPELKVHLSDELDKRFRKTAMATYGYGRGSISKAATEALTNWCRDHEHSNNSTPAEVSQKDTTIVSVGITEAPQLDHQEENREGRAASPV